MAVDILIPTMDNEGLLKHALNSIIAYTDTACSYHIRVVNNGVPGSVTRNLSAHERYSVIEAGGNKGWEGGLNLGLAASTAPYVMFLNDDVHVLPSDPFWLTKMLSVLVEHPDVAAVGPTSNFVMGYQHIHTAMDPKPYEAKLLIGFCVLLRRADLDAVGGVTEGLVGGDDFDLSLRLAAAGKKMAIHGGVYLHHWGCQTGNRVKPGWWNSPEMNDATRNEMIRRHKLRPYLTMLQHRPTPL